MNSRPAPQGSSAPVLVLCRQCIRYVYEGTTVCPHCGGDAREISTRYLEGGYLAIETIQRIARAAERRRR
jgi:RNA polymerase subunit RPABC4/transcription elongation factor Spt4